MRRSRRGCLAPLGLIALAAVAVAAVTLLVVLQQSVLGEYGPPADHLGMAARLKYTIRLWWHNGLLTAPAGPPGAPLPFRIEAGESVEQVAVRIEEARLARSSAALLDFLVYKGWDTEIQAAEYSLVPTLSIVELAARLRDPAPTEVTFVVLPGWRLEEIAASIPTSGLEFEAADLLTAARRVPASHPWVPASALSMEGILFPGTYVVPRALSPDALVSLLANAFEGFVSGEVGEGFSQQGLDVYSAAILASIVEREGVHDDEHALIASVFLNRLQQGMKLDSDPTVQYALGYNAVQHTWWTNPLSYDDLQVASDFNTYARVGLPPAPISNPGESALRAVAWPATTAYLYFRANCSGDGYHSFATTYQEHLQNACP